MSARDVIASELARISRVDVDEAPAYARASVRTAALHVERALTAAGYRILGPGELDVETVEKCAQVAERAGKPAGASDGGTYVVGSATDAAADIRALASGESR